MQRFLPSDWRYSGRVDNCNETIINYIFFKIISFECSSKKMLYAQHKFHSSLMGTRDRFKQMHQMCHAFSTRFPKQWWWTMQRCGLIMATGTAFGQNWALAQLKMLNGFTGLYRSEIQWIEWKLDGIDILLIRLLNKKYDANGCR